MRRRTAIPRDIPGLRAVYDAHARLRAIAITVSQVLDEGERDPTWHEGPESEGAAVSEQMRLDVDAGEIAANDPALVDADRIVLPRADVDLRDLILRRAIALDALRMLRIRGMGYPQLSPHLNSILHKEVEDRAGMWEHNIPPDHKLYEYVDRAECGALALATVSTVDEAITFATGLLSEGARALALGDALHSMPPEPERPKRRRRRAKAVQP